MIAWLIAPIYLLLHLYLLLRLLYWLGAFHRHLASRSARSVLTGLFFILAVSPLAGFLIPTGLFHRIFRVLANCWMGVLLYALLAVLAADSFCFMIRRLCSRFRRQPDRGRLCRRAGCLTLAAVCLVSLYGVGHARSIIVDRRQVEIQKSCTLPSLRVALIADLHLGYNAGNGLMKQMVEKLNREKPDLVCLAGDIFDNEYDAIQNPDQVAHTLAGIQCRYGVYAVFGNHDLKERVLAGFTFKGSGADKKQDDSRFLTFLKKAHIQLLQDDGVLIDNAFYLFGRKDKSRVKKTGEDRLSSEQLLEGTDSNKPILVMDHQPKELSALAAAGADMVLSGHTHDGQLFPGNLLVRLINENAGGIKKIEAMTSAVTSGVGVWGPAMRVGTDSEILLLDISFTG